MQSSINAKIVDEQLWNEFHPITEMIVTRVGRAMFPKLAFNIVGLLDTLFYAFSIRFERCDNSKYKFENGEWVESARADPVDEPKIIRHPKGFKSGKDWMSEPLQFPGLKITNNMDSTKPSHYCLQTMHKYRPVLTIYQMGEDLITMVPIQEFRFTIAEFFAVTAYQNNEVTKLKIAKNKYAGAFRAENSRKRAAAKMQQEEQQDRIFENVAKRAPWPVPQYHPGYNMPVNMDMSNLYYHQQQQLPMYNTYPMAAPTYQPMGTNQMAYNPAGYWPHMMQPTMQPTLQPSPAPSDHSGTYQSSSPDFTNNSV